MSAIRDTIQGLTKGGIDRLARKAGVSRLSNLMHEEVRGAAKMYLEDLGAVIRTHLETSGVATVQEKHVHLAAKSMGAHGHNLVHHGDMGSCNGRNYDTKIRMDREKRDALPLTKHANPGTVAERKITYYQKRPATCFSFAMTKFAALARELISANSTPIRFSEKALELLQLDVESYLTHQLQQANEAARNANRKTVMPKDLQLVRYVKGMRA